LPPEGVTPTIPPSPEPPTPPTAGPSPRERPLPARIEDRLRRGEDRSAAIWSAALWAVQAGWSEREFRELVMTTRAGSKLRGRRDPARYIHET
jgi:hypothetical protein